MAYADLLPEQMAEVDAHVRETMCEMALRHARNNLQLKREVLAAARAANAGMDVFIFTGAVRRAELGVMEAQANLLAERTSLSPSVLLAAA